MIRAVLENYRDLYRYRALVWGLVVRHLATRYRGSFLGFLWSFLNPLCLMLVYLLVFRYYIRFQEVENYTIFLFCGLLPWIWLTSGLTEGTSAIVSGGHLITKSMFPAQVLPTVSVLTSMIHFLLSLPLLFLFIAADGLPLFATLLVLPLLLLVQFSILHGLSLLLGALNVRFRDVQHIVANLLTLLFFLTPILYPVDTVPSELRFTMTMNPLAVLTECYHNLILDGALPSLFSAAYLVGFALVAVLCGNVIFNRYRESFAEAL